MRIGIGNDIHRLVKGRPLVLGGIEIPHEKGLDGHSDADVLVHAICDALLGAAAMGDIGIHFPPGDPAYKNIYSIDLLKRTWELVSGRYPAICNIDCTVFAESPKLAPHTDRMRQMISRTLTLPVDRISIKATTSEGLGFVGRGEGIAAMCVVLLD